MSSFHSLRLLALGLGVTAASASAVPLKDIAGLSTVRVWETTYSTLPSDFSPTSPQLARIAGDLGSTAYDISYYPGEYYDVFYSNADGTANGAGAYLTIEGVWRAGSLSLYGGMNINQVELLIGATTVAANAVTHATYGSTCVTSYGANCITGSEALAVDGDLSTFPRFGQTSDGNLAERFSLTVAFGPYSIQPVPEPATWGLMGLGLAALAWRRRR